MSRWGRSSACTTSWTIRVCALTGATRNPQGSRRSSTWRRAPKRYRDRLTACSMTGSTPRGSAVAPGAISASPSKGMGTGKVAALSRSGWRTPSRCVTTCGDRPGTGRDTFLPWWREATRGNVDGMARDDDTDYTMLALRILEKYGPGFTSADVGAEWLCAAVCHGLHG